MNTYEWMLVTNDAVELPIVSAKSCAELARRIGKTESNVYRALKHGTVCARGRVIKVEISEDESEDENEIEIVQLST